jgi:hypothetical protein
VVSDLPLAATIRFFQHQLLPDEPVEQRQHLSHDCCWNHNQTLARLFVGLLLLLLLLRDLLLCL